MRLQMKKYFGISALVACLFPFESTAKPSFTELQYNKKWYRTFDSTSDIIPDKGQLLFNWVYEDPQKQNDSFYVGIDTLWGLPQDLNSDTLQDWDLQVCPNGFCMNGLKAGVHGANAPDNFGNNRFSTEHHFQFFPAVSPKTYRFTGPEGSLFGALMFCRSRSTEISDTVLAYGSWGLMWDSLSPPPVHPVAGYLPHRADFMIYGDSVRYVGKGAGIKRARGNAKGAIIDVKILKSNHGLEIRFPELMPRKSVAIFSVDAKKTFYETEIPADQALLLIDKADLSRKGAGVLLLRLSSGTELTWTVIPFLTN